VDEFVGEWVLKTLEPAALELSLEASEHIEKEREEIDRHSDPAGEQGGVPQLLPPVV
jgi:hypothetical protein